MPFVLRLSYLDAEAGLPGALLVFAQRVPRVNHPDQPIDRIA